MDEARFPWTVIAVAPSIVSSRVRSIDPFMRVMAPDIENVIVLPAHAFATASRSRLGASATSSESVVTTGFTEQAAYERGDEQSDVLPAASVAVAVNTVELGMTTVAVRPGDAKFAALPIVTGPPLQLEEA